MAKRETLHLSRYQSIETYKDWNGRIFIACSSGSSRMFDDRKELLRFLKIPKSIPMRATLDSWLDSLEAADAQRKKAEPMDELRQASADVSGVELTDHVEPLISEEPVQQTAPSLSQEHLTTGWGPEVFSGELDESDPNHNTRVIT